MNQQRVPSSASNSNIGCLLGFGVFGAIGIALCMLCSLPSALSSITTNPLSSFLIILVFLGSIAGGVWLLVFWLRFSTARAQQLEQEQAIRVKQQYDAYVAQQQYAAYVAQQQQYQAYTAQKQYTDQQEAEEEQETDEVFLERISALVGLLSLSPSDFKRVVLLLFESWGYPEIKELDGAGLAVDFICRDERGEVTAVQCKR